MTMGLDPENRRVAEQIDLAIDHEAPVLHGASGEVGRRQHIQLG